MLSNEEIGPKMVVVHDELTSLGGSSGCLGSAVASGVMSMALGSDTGGSIGNAATVFLPGAACESATDRHHRRPSFYLEVAT